MLAMVCVRDLGRGGGEEWVAGLRVAYEHGAISCHVSTGEAMRAEVCAAFGDDERCGVSWRPAFALARVGSGIFGHVALRACSHRVRARARRRVFTFTAACCAGGGGRGDFTPLSC